MIFFVVIIHGISIHICLHDFGSKKMYAKKNSVYISSILNPQYITVF